MAGREKSTDRIRSPIDGLDLVVHRWLPGEPVQRVLVIQHGFGDHALRYGHVIESLQVPGTAFFALDARGHGASPGIRGHASSFQDFSADLAALVAMIRSQYSNLPIGLFGHSMGGAICLELCLNPSHQPQLQFLVVSAPALRIRMTPAIRIKKFVGEYLARVLPDFVVEAGLDPVLLSHDATVVQAYISDPKVHGKISLAMGASLFAVGERVLSRASAITLPICIIHGTADEICMPAGSEELFARVASEDKSLRFYPNLRHETFNEVETDRRKVLADLAAWVQSHW